VREEGMALPQAVAFVPEVAAWTRAKRRNKKEVDAPIQRKEMKKRLLTDTCVAGGVL
jgi:hypothetical protein